MRMRKTQISKIRNEKRELTKDTKEIQESWETTLRTYIPINWKILKKDTFLDTNDWTKKVLTT
jgi:hypothetical protein